MLSVDPVYDVTLGPVELVEGRPFTDPAETHGDAAVMRLMLARERALAAAWTETESADAWMSEQAEDGLRHLLVFPDRARLVGARDVTVVGFFGQRRPGVDHAVVFALERDVLDSFPVYAKVGLLSYYDMELEELRFANLILFWTADVPDQWYRNAAHEQAVAIAPDHYRTVRLHRGRIPGRLLGTADLKIERTRYFDFEGGRTWRALRLFVA